MQAMQAWGLAPDEWRRKSVDDRARMMASEMVKGMRSSWLNEKTRGDHKNAKPAMNDYEKQKAEMRRMARMNQSE